MTISAHASFCFACASGFLYPSFPAFDFGLIAWFALVPLHIAVEYAAPRRAFRVGWLAGSVAFTGAMFLVITAMNVYGKVPSRLPHSSCCCSRSISAVSGRLCRSPVVDQNGVSHLGVSAGTLSLGHPGVDPHVLSLRPALGALRVLSISVAAHYPVCRSFRRLWRLVSSGVGQCRPGGNTDLELQGLSWFQIRSFPWPSSVAAGAGFGWPCFTAPHSCRPLSMCRLARCPSSRATERRTGSKWDVAFRQETMSRFDRLTTGLGDNLDLIVWPGSRHALRVEMEPLPAPRGRHGTARRSASPVRQSGLAAAPGRPPVLLNSAYLLATDGQILGRYDKQHLVPFGEYIRFITRCCSFSISLWKESGTSEAGPGSTLLMFKPHEKSPPLAAAATNPDFHLKFGVVICYEVIFPNLVRQFAANGADFMVTVTNDAWFGPSSRHPINTSAWSSFAPWKTMSRLRGGEYRHLRIHRSVWPRVAAVIDLHQRGAAGTIPVSHQQTFYSQYGDLFAYACAILIALLCLTGYFSHDTEPAGGEPAGRPA